VGREALALQGWVPLAQARARLSLPGASVEVAQNFRDKARMKDLFAAHDIGCARHRLCATVAEAVAASGAVTVVGGGDSAAGGVAPATRFCLAGVARGCAAAVAADLLSLGCGMVTRIRVALGAVMLGLTAGVAAAQPALKVNTLTTLVLVPQLGLEWTRGARTSAQVDLMVSPWRSVDGAPMQFVMVVPEWRWHLRQVGSGPYIGVHLGATAFRLQKWEYRHRDYYQTGFGLLAGVTLGVQRQMGRHWLADAFIGGGTVQSKYKGYYISTGERYDDEPGYNESGEWLPYRGGVMISYRR